MYLVSLMFIEKLKKFNSDQTEPHNQQTLFDPLLLDSATTNISSGSSKNTPPYDNDLISCLDFNALDDELISINSMNDALIITPEISNNNNNNNSNNLDSTPAHPRPSRTSSRASKPIDETIEEDLEVLVAQKRAADQDYMDSPESKPKKLGKKLKSAKENGESKDPKYLLTNQVITIENNRYCRAYRRPPVSFSHFINPNICINATDRFLMLI